MLRNLGLATVLASAVALAACSQQSETYMDLAGGGFIFNYRIAEAYAGVVLVPRKPLPADATIQVTMENPAGGQPLVMKQSTPPGTGRIELTTEPLKGIKADTDYAVHIRLVAADGTDLQVIDKKFRSQLDESVLPSAPLTIGPGYTPNPQLDADPPKPL